tara:strand:- start:94326 stop:94517 length:192 start_codon:yes stop_codon:yes gene_type:complete
MLLLVRSLNLAAKEVSLAARILPQPDQFAVALLCAPRRQLLRLLSSVGRLSNTDQQAPGSLNP